jgi:hypothetical protein
MVGGVRQGLELGLLFQRSAGHRMPDKRAWLLGKTLYEFVLRQGLF